MKKEKKEFTINELAAIEQHITVLRACPAIPFTLANDVNLNFAPIKTGIAKHNEKMDLLKERNDAIENTKDTISPEEYKQVIDENKKELIDLFKVKNEMEISVIPISVFADIDITNDKIVKQPDGSTLNFPYRDAYFALLELGLISQ